MTADPDDGARREERIDQILRLEAEREDWAGRKPRWRPYIACASGLAAGGVLVPFARGLLFGIAIVGVLFAPAQLWVRGMRLRDVDRRLEALRGGTTELLPEGARRKAEGVSPPSDRGVGLP